MLQQIAFCLYGHVLRLSVCCNVCRCGSRPKEYPLGSRPWCRLLSQPGRWTLGPSTATPLAPQRGDPRWPLQIRYHQYTHHHHYTVLTPAETFCLELPENVSIFFFLSVGFTGSSMNVWYDCTSYRMFTKLPFPPQLRPSCWKMRHIVQYDLDSDTLLPSDST